MVDTDDTRQTIHDRRRTTPRVWHKLPTGELKIWFLSHNFMTDVGGTTNTLEAQSRNMINICTQYGFDSLIISGSYGGHTHDTQ